MSDGENPTPPGNPMREDQPDGGRPGGHDDEVSAHPASGGHTIPIEDEQPDPQHGDDSGGEDELQEENAETSLDQPSQ